MDKKVLDHLGNLPSCLISFSGGLDSSLVTMLAREFLAKGSILAVTFDSWLNPPEEIAEAVRFCKKLEIEHMIRPAPELEEKKVLNNDPSRCGVCKECRIRDLILVAQSRNIPVILDGTNADDRKDSTRLGNLVLEKYSSFLYSPLAEGGMGKGDILSLAAEIDLPWSGRPSTACLATRFPWNYEICEEEAKKINEAEKELLTLGLSKIRVRVFSNMASIEVLPSEMELAFLKREEMITVLREMGFERINLDLDGYRTGRGWLNLNSGKTRGGNS